MSKRKASSDINSRNKKKVKQDAADPLLQSFEGFFLLPKDCRREIVRHINDIDMLKSLRTSRQWREEATAEINSRFACKVIFFRKERRQFKLNNNCTAIKLILVYLKYFVEI
jgi:hypothetical protein